MNEVREMKQVYQRAGFSLLVMGIGAVVAQLLLGVVLGLFGVSAEAQTEGWFKWLVAFVPMYLIAMPLFVLMIKKLPAKEGAKKKLPVKDFLLFLLIGFPVIYGGNLIGTLLSMLLSGGQAVNGLETYAFDTGILKFLVLVVIGPFMEEWIFRKQLIDRCVQYGRKKAVFFSALTFALFHMNLFQFFYAFGVGLIFAYLYVRTRNLLYPFIMHMIVNFMGGIVGPWIIGKIDLAALEELTASGVVDETMLMEMSSDLLPGLMLLVIYGMVLMTVSVIGLIILIIKGSKSKFLATKEPACIRTVYGNAGVVCYIIFCLIFFVISLFAV